MLAAGMAPSVMMMVVVTTTTATISQISVQIEHKGCFGRTHLPTNNFYATLYQGVTSTLANSTTDYHLNAQSRQKIKQGRMSLTIGRNNFP